ncbi:MAG TPA: sigma-70 family RNA polymerase sigma factor [Candidatus Limnocylindrales bacterium]
MAIEAGAQSDREVRAVLLARLPDAHKLASWILHDPVAAEDAVQEAALLAWGRRRTLRDPATAEAWFNRILVNVCRSELRRRSRRRLVTEVEPTIDGPHRVLADRDELTQAIRRLRPDEQLLLALRFGRDLTVPAVAATTGMPEGTVKSRLHTALENLRAALEAERRAERRIEESRR